MFPFDVVELRENVGGNLFVAAQFVRQEFEAPAYIAVAVERADAPIFAVNERLAFVLVTGNVVEARPDVRCLNDFLDVLAGAFVVVDVEVPRVDVRIAVREVIEMFPVADAHVFD